MARSTQLVSQHLENISSDEHPLEEFSLPPWASGPAEILRHGMELIEKDSDTNRRLAMIAVDNAVELTIKTFLGLPKRITNLTITRKEFQDIAENFPALLDGLEKHASKEIKGVDLGSIEWFHRLRNELYHNGNGLTVERANVEVYAALANELFKKLFGLILVPPKTDKSKLLHEFLECWTVLEAAVIDMATNVWPTVRTFPAALKFLNAGTIGDDEVREIKKFSKIRNLIVHEYARQSKILTKELVNELKALVEKYRDIEGISEF